MPVEFNSAVFATPSTELNPLPGVPLDPEFLTRYARTLDDFNFKYTLIPYNSAGFDPFTLGSHVLTVTKKLSVIIALRPNTMYPTVAAKQLATLDQIGGGGRVVVHFIAGGSDAEQAREGDFLNKTERYARQEEYIRILKRAWSSPAPFDWEGKYYQFKDFRANVRPLAGHIPISVGGSSEDAYRVGGTLADIFGLWGEPLKETKQQIDRVNAYAAQAGRTDRPRIWVTFRPIVAPTDALAWIKAHKTLDRLNQNSASQLAAEKALREKQTKPGEETDKAVAVASLNGGRWFPSADSKETKFAEPQNVGSQRLLDIAKRGDVQDRALWYPTVTATNARGASTALVGSYQTVVDSIIDYVDLGADLISIRGYDNLNDAIEYGQHILPGVYKALAEREAVGTTKAAAPAVVSTPAVVEAAKPVEVVVDQAKPVQAAA